MMIFAWVNDFLSSSPAKAGRSSDHKNSPRLLDTALFARHNRKDRHRIVAECQRRARTLRQALAAVSHSIRSSASIRTKGGIVRPRALAVLTLMTSSNL